MTYKIYAARIEYSDEDECFVGRVFGIRDIITFHGESVAEVRYAFQEAVDFYSRPRKGWEQLIQEALQAHGDKTANIEWLNAPLTDDSDWGAVSFDNHLWYYLGYERNPHP